MCNCADALIRTTICKHIHLVSRFNLKDLKTHNETSPDQTVDLLDDDTFHVEDIKGQDTSKRHVSETALLENLQEKSQLCDTVEVQTQLSDLNGHLHLIQDTETLKGIKSYISSALNLIKARQNLGKSFEKKNHLKNSKDPSFQQKGREKNEYG